MKYKIIPLVICLLLVTSLAFASAKGLEDRPTDKNLQLKIDKTLHKLTDKGIIDKNSKEIIKSKDKSEIWIEKKMNLGKGKNRYHIDSLIQEDTIIDIELFYEFQPDKIDYLSHNGKYSQIYTPEDWIWEDIECPEGDCGGYLTLIEVPLEYGLGSNTLTSAISGATWLTDETLITLTRNTDYTLSGSTFNIINEEYAWSSLNVSWSYNTAGNGSVTQVANLIIVFVALAILSFILLIINYYTKQIKN